jgi:Fe2+ transport system protein FeoA
MVENAMHCTMCGYEFERSQLTCHAACPLGAACMVVCCPRCGYSTVDENRSKMSRWAQRLLKKSAQPGPVGSVGVRLLDMRPGQEGHIADIEGKNDLLRQLSHYGPTPGTPVRLQQKKPVPVVQVGETDLALDSSIAGQIFVEL